MRILQLVHGPHLLKTSQDFWRFELSIWLHAVGRALIGVFIPFLILRLGFSLKEVILYYLIFNLMDVPLNFAAKKLVTKIGAKRTIIAATAASIAYFALLANVPAGNFKYLILLAFLDAFYDAAYWVAHVYLFLKSSRSHAAAGRQTGILHSMRTLAAAMGPMIGALLLLFGRSDQLIWASVLFFAVSLIPLFRLKHTSDKPRHEVVAMKEFFAEPEDRKNYLANYLIHFIGAAESIIWPLFIYSIYGTTESIAYVAIAVSLGSAAFSYLASLIEEHGRTVAIISGAALAASAWIIRILFPHPAAHFGTVAVMGFFLLLMIVPNDCRLYARARERYSLHAATYRNALSMSAHLTLFAILAISADIFQATFVMVFAYLGAIIALHAIYRPKVAA